MTNKKCCEKCEPVGQDKNGLPVLGCMNPFCECHQPQEVDECECKEMTCKEDCDKNHTHKTFWCEKCIKPKEVLGKKIYQCKTFHKDGLPHKCCEEIGIQEVADWEKEFIKFYNATPKFRECEEFISFITKTIAQEKEKIIKEYKKSINSIKGTIHCAEKTINKN
jgi:hypothetical protein